MSIKVTIIEDHVEFRESVFYLLQGTEGYKCVGTYGSVEEALAKMPQADIILLDIHLPNMSGIQAIPLIKKKIPNAKIVILTVFDDDRHVFDALVAGADGYLLKKTAPVRLLQAIEDAANGGSPMTPSIAKQTIELFRDHVPPKKEDPGLTERELEILQLLVDGYNNEQIAEKLSISWQTVRNHIRHIYEKLHVHSKSDALVKAIKQGIV